MTLITVSETDTAGKREAEASRLTEAGPSVREARPITIGGRVNEDQLAKVDAAARLARVARAHFIVQATLEKADEVIRRIASEP